MADAFQHIVAFCLDHPWAITRPMLGTIADILAQHIVGKPPSYDSKANPRDTLPRSEGGAIAVLPIHGVLVPRGTLLSNMSGATSLDALSADFRALMSDESIETIVLDVDSPGGSVAGVTEFAREVLRARAKKPIVAHARYTMASAAYWIAASATEIVGSPSAMVGSVGVYTIHEDLSAAMDKLGVKRTYIAAGKHKVEGNDAEPLTEEARAQIQQRVDDVYAQFVGDVAKGRGVSVSDVRKGYGEGRAVNADDALKLGMVDKVATFDETIARLASVAPARGMRAETEIPVIATAQEPSPATAQERLSDPIWRAKFETALLSTQL